MAQIVSSQIEFGYLKLCVYEPNSVKGEARNGGPKAGPWPDNVWWIDYVFLP